MPEWIYEPADPGVGWMTGFWIHNDCPLEEADTTETVVSFSVDGDVLTNLIRISCTCGASFETTESEWVGEDGS